MKLSKTAVFLFLAIGAMFAATVDPVLAHRFNVVLILPGSTTGSEQARHIRGGFMLATTERDSHPDQQSDGHLGGLDVYVNVIDGTGDLAADFKRLLAKAEINIVAAFETGKTHALIRRLLGGKKIALLLPGQTPFAETERPAVAAFISAYEKAHGRKPSSGSAQGYNMARRIDLAVRAQGSVDDLVLLRKSFEKTARDFTW